MFSAASVFVQLQQSLNTIWDVEPRPEAGIGDTIRKRLLSFAIVLLLGVLLLCSLVLGSVLSVGFDIFGANAALVRVLNESVTVVFLAVFLALIFKYLPDVSISWRDVWAGALLTAVLLTAGKYLIGLYLGRSSIASTYGAAGSLVLLLIWAYYAGVIFFLGAEITKVWARRSGRGIAPDTRAPLADSAASVRESPPGRTQPSRSASPGKARVTVGATPESIAPRSAPTAVGRSHREFVSSCTAGALYTLGMLLVPLLIGAARRKLADMEQE
jgi:membrane protein